MDEAPWYLTVSLPALLRHARTTYGQAMRRALEAEGHDDIPGNGLYVIGAIALNEEPVATEQIARDLRLDRDRARALIGALVVAGYIGVDDAAEGKILHLAERGQQAAAIQLRARQEVDAALEAKLGGECVAQGRLMLATLIEMERAEAG